jgi:hypothetical protein
MLEEELKPATYSKCIQILTNRVVLHHEKAQPDMVAATTEMIHKLRFELLPHPAYSPDFTPHEYYIFRLLEDALHG